jgi:hypothetical protein
LIHDPPATNAPGLQKPPFVAAFGRLGAHFSSPANVYVDGFNLYNGILKMHKSQAV